MPPALPIESIRERFDECIARGPVVLTAQTGSGKSTRVPLWCRARGQVVVVEPRRVACSSLASIVSEFEGAQLGKEIGYVVRGDRRVCTSTEVTYMTPGIALRLFAAGELTAETVIIDEFHERTLDTDLLLSLLRHSRAPSQEVVVMSATLDAEPLAAWLGAQVLTASGRTFPVEISHVSSPALPELGGLEERVETAVRQSLRESGDILVFLPGKSEISRCMSRLSGRIDADILPLHGGLSLQEQNAAISSSTRQRVVLATNVAETSLTVPGVTTVIDSGLVRRTAYHYGRSYLTCVPVAVDSADQRAGRAGRVRPGRCVRLWAGNRGLSPSTPPEVHREALSTLALNAACCGYSLRTLSLPSAPKPYAIEDAMEALRNLGALTEDERLTERGRRMFHIPVDPHLGSFLLEAERRGVMQEAIDLAAVLSVSRPLFVSRPEDDEDPLCGPDRCDAVAMIRAVREGRAKPHGLSAHTLMMCRQRAKELRHTFDVDQHHGPIARKSLALAMLHAWPTSAYVRRRRKRTIAWGNGGPEARLGRDVHLNPERWESLIAVDLRGLASDRGKRDLVITAAMPCPVQWLCDAGLGELRVSHAVFRGGTLMMDAERVYAGKSIGTIQEEPTGDALIEAGIQALRSGRWLKGVWEDIETRLTSLRLAHGLGLVTLTVDETDEEWTRTRLSGLGLTEASDTSLVEAEDLYPPSLPPDIEETLRRKYPAVISVGGNKWKVHYETARRCVWLERVAGKKGTVPPSHYLPAFTGWKVELREASNIKVLRGR